jgi:ATP:ADP antiporter, AAA family
MTKNFLQKIFTLKEEETPLFGLLFLNSLFTGFFLAIFFVPANSLFVRNFGTSYLPVAYIIAGFIGFIFSSVYTRLQAWFPDIKLLRGTIWFVAALTVFSALAGSIFPNAKWPAYFLFVWSWPLVTVFRMLTGGIHIRLLDIRQSKKMLGNIGTGSTVASIVGFFLSPALLSFMSQYQLLFVATIGLAGAFVVYNRIFSIHGKKFEVPKGSKKFESLGFKEILRNKYYRLIMVSATLSTVIIYFTDFSFLASIRQQPDLQANPQAIAMLLSVLFGMMKVGELIMSFFSGNILNTYGIRLGLNILPFISVLFVTGAIGASFTEAGTLSSFYLVLMITNKSSERILRRALDDPSFNVLYQPLPQAHKIAIQAKTSVIMQQSTAIAGVLLLLGMVAFSHSGKFDLKYFNFFFLFLLLCWSVVTVLLYAAYKARLKQVLKDKKIERDLHFTTFNFGSDILEHNLSNEESPHFKTSAILMAETVPEKLMTRSNWKEIGKIEEVAMIVQSKIKAYPQTKEQLTEEKLRKLAVSTNEQDQLLAISALQAGQVKNIPQTLEKLFKSPFKNVKREAIFLASQYPSQQITDNLIDLLKDHEYALLAMSSLVVYENRILHDIEQIFNREKDIFVLKIAIELCVKIGTRESIGLLIIHLNFPDTEIQAFILNSLFSIKFHADSSQIPVIKQKLQETINIYLWFNAGVNDLQHHRNTLKLIQSLEQGQEMYFNRIFNLLGLIYNHESIALIREYLNTPDNVFAIEIADILLSDDVKEMVMPIFEDLPLQLMLDKLQLQFPQQKLSMKERLQDIINKDYNLVDMTLKIRAMDLLHKVTGNELLPEFMASVFHPHELMNSAALKIVFDISSTAGHEIVARNTDLSPQLATFYRYNEQKTGSILPERKLKLITRIEQFYGLTEKTFARLYEIIDYKPLAAGYTLSLINVNGNELIVILLSGEVKTDCGENRFSTNNQFLIRGIQLPAETNMLMATKDSTLFVISRSLFFGLTLIEPELRQHFMEGRMRLKEIKK